MTSIFTSHQKQPLVSSSSLQSPGLDGQYERLDDHSEGSDGTYGYQAAPSSISRFNVARFLKERRLLWAINAVACLAILFFGYDQGVMGSINDVEDYYDRTMRFGHWDAETGAIVVTNEWLKGTIVSLYYFGTLVGCFFGGSLGDSQGRIRIIGYGSVVAIIGASLQAGALNSSMMMLARIITGLGTGMLNAVVPVWATETAEHTSRGQFVASEFTLNIFGVALAYWTGYACSFYGNGESSFSWRFPIALQILPLVILLMLVWHFPESPRWLVKVGRKEEARWILGRLRGETSTHSSQAETEFQDICKEVKWETDENKLSQNYFTMYFGIGSGPLHIGRRVQLVIFLQILQECVGIAGVTIYGRDIFRIAGISDAKTGWVSGLNNTIYLLATLICVFTLDRIGRRNTLFWGAAVMGIFMFFAGLFSSKAAADENPGLSFSGVAAVSCVFLFTATFGATWLTVPWLYPAEIFPLQIRAKGNAWGVAGWSIGNLVLAWLCPVLFETLHEKTLYIFAACNFITIPIVWALYPETNQRTLEDINLVFSSDSIWNWEAERKFAALKVEVQPTQVDSDEQGGPGPSDPVPMPVNTRVEDLDGSDKDDEEYYQSARETQPMLSPQHHIEGI